MLAINRHSEVESRSIDGRLEETLRKRMSLPQRHRLLHAYPLLAGMPHVGVHESDALRTLKRAAVAGQSTDKGLLIGVLPHPFCNPMVSGCGYCTFPHERFRASTARSVVSAVVHEIRKRRSAEPHLGRTQVDGLYLGGGTANLTPTDSLRKLTRVLNTSFDLRHAEVTLEGVPIYFLKREKPMDVMRGEIDARHFRISMGIQTFDRKQLGRMGRLAFGDLKTVANVVSYAHEAGLTVSGDLLFNLPGQSRNAMRDDLRRAIELGLDQICLYHLVLFRGLGTEWSRTPELLDALPSNQQACRNWTALRNELLLAGYVQTTLTNFERRSVHNTFRRFNYENLSFRPNRYNMVGFGPSGISFASNKAFTRGWKSTNPDSSSEYLQRLKITDTPFDRFFDYGDYDLRVFYLTRRLAALAIDFDDYEAQFGVPELRDFADQLATLSHAGLIEERGNAFVPTPKGMFYADAMASLFAQNSKAAFPGKRAAHRLSRTQERHHESNVRGHM